MSLAAYKSTIKNTETPRGLERRMLTSITGRLAAKSAEFEALPEGGPRLQVLADGLRAALNDNLRLWSAFRTDLSSPGNALPAELRANLLSLSFFVEEHTAKVLAGKAAVTPLIDVNTPLVEAMNGQQGDAA